MKTSMHTQKKMKSAAAAAAEWTLLDICLGKRTVTDVCKSARVCVCACAMYGRVVLSYRNPIARVFLPKKQCKHYILFYVIFGKQIPAQRIRSMRVCVNLDFLFCWIDMRIDRQNDTQQIEIKKREGRRIRMREKLFINVYTSEFHIHINDWDTTVQTLACATKW